MSIKLPYGGFEWDELFVEYLSNYSGGELAKQVRAYTEILNKNGKGAFFEVDLKCENTLVISTMTFLLPLKIRKSGKLLSSSQTQ